MNAFEIKIGKITTKGNFLEVENFVAVSESTPNELKLYLSEKYKPLTVQVHNATEIVINVPEPEKKVIEPVASNQP